MTMNTVNSQVSSMLGAIDLQLAGDQILKMAIALLILEVLLGKEGGKEAGGAMLMAALGFGNSSSASMSVESTSMQASYSSSFMSSSASQSSDSGDADRGGRLDTQA